MSFVMVPCPEEFLPDLQAGVMAMAMAGSGWQDHQIADFVADLDDRGRILVQAVATAAVQQDRVAYTSVAALLETDVGSALGLVTEINDWCDRERLPLPIITHTQRSTGSDGEAVAVPVLSLLPLVAKRVLAAMGSDQR